MLKTVTYDDATHVVVRRKITENIFNAIDNELDSQRSETGIAVFLNSPQYPERLFSTMVAAAPPFTSLPNPDLDLLDYALNEGHEEYGLIRNINEIRAALKRIKGDV